MEGRRMSTLHRMEVTRGYVCASDDDRDIEVIIPIRAISHVTVDWTVESGQIQIWSNRPIASLTTVIFSESDCGQECADALSDLCRVLNGEEPR